MSLPGMLPFDALLPDWWLTAYVGGIVALPVLTLLIFSLRILSQRKALPIHSLLPPAQIPGELRRYGQPWIGRLGFLGFSLQACVRTENSDPDDSVSWRLASAADQTVAILDGVLPAGGAKPDFSLTLLSFLSDGRVIVTADRRLTRRPPPHWSLVEKRYQTLQQQVEDHRGLVAALRGEATPALPTPQALPSVLAAEDQAVLDALAASGDFVPSDEEGKVLRPSPLRAPVLAYGELAAIFTGKAFPSGRRQDIASVGKSKSQEDEEEAAPAGATAAPTMEQTVEGDIRRFRTLTNTPFTNKHRALRLIFLIITVVALVAASGKHSVVFKVLSLLGILTLHEFGHWVAMTAFGYTRMGRFFVPLIGPVNRGRKSDAAAWQQLIVILAGPLPGLFAGCILLFAGYFLPVIPRWMLDAAGLAVLYNAFQLLPFLPLDGGKVVDLLVFRDLPLIRPIFTGIAAAGTLAAAYFQKSPFLCGFAACMLAGLFWDIRRLGVVRGGRKLGWSQEVKSEDEALRRIFTGIRSEQNEAFFRSSDWFRRIDVLVGEVLRKRPQMTTRIFGGAFYMATCVLPIVVMTGIIVLLTKGGNLDLNQPPKDIIDFHSQFPRKTQDIPFSQLAGLVRLLKATRGGETDKLRFKDAPPASERAGLAAAAAPALLQELDRIDWPSVGIASHQYLMDNYTLSVWLELLCGKLETATRGGKTVEATRRAEVLLFAISSLDPSPTYNGRELVRDAELRTLAAVENLAASGKLDAATLARLEGRINLLNKAPLPEVENLLLIDGWATARGAGLMSQLAAGKVSRPEPSFEGLDWPLAYQRLRKMVRLTRLRYHDAPTIALAKYWKTSRKTGELPDHLENVASPDPGEGDFIASFCEAQRRITWRRMTTLSALSLETYRLKTGKLPAKWEHKLPEDATLALIADKGPLLQLSGRPESTRPALPSWLGEGAKKEAAFDYRCPLFGAPVAELSRK